MANGQQGGTGYQANTQPTAQPAQKPAFQPGQDYWAQKSAAMNPTGASSFNYNVNKMQPGWWNGAQNQGSNGVVSQYGGPISASSITPQDQAFLANASRYMGGGFDPRNIINGGADQASQLLGGDTYKGMAAFQKNPQQAMQGVSPAVMQAMGQMASQNPQLQQRWNSLTGGGAPQAPMGVQTPFNPGATTGGNMIPPNNSLSPPRFLGGPVRPGVGMTVPPNLYPDQTPQPYGSSGTGMTVPPSLTPDQTPQPYGQPLQSQAGMFTGYNQMPWWQTS